HPSCGFRRYLSNGARAMQTAMNPMVSGMVAHLDEAKSGGRRKLRRGPKNFTNKSLSKSTFLPHVVYPRASSRNNLLFANVHKLLLGLFTIFRMYSQSLTYSHFP